MDWTAFLHEIIGSSQKDITWWQMTIRGVVAFIFGLVLLRLFGRRAFSQQSPLDILLSIVIGSNLSRAVTGNAPFFPTLFVTAVLALLYFVLDRLAARWPGLSRLVKGRPTWLMREEGALDRAAMTRAGVGMGDVEATRSSGTLEVGQLKAVVLERNGKISTISKS